MSASEKPLFERGRIKIYSRNGSNGKRYYDVVDGRDHKRPYQASMEAAHSGVNLTPKQVWSIMSGDAVEIDAMGAKGTYKAFLFLRGIGEKQSVKEGKTYTNRFVNLGRALPVVKAASGELIGFSLRHPEATQQGDNRSVTVFLSYGSKDHPVTLEDPGQAYRLLKGDPVTIEGRGTLSLDTIEAKPRDDGNGNNYTAKVTIEWAQSASSRFTFADDDGGESTPTSRASHVSEDTGEPAGGEGDPDPDDDPFAPAPSTRRQLAA